MTRVLNLWSGQNGFTPERGFTFYSVEIDYVNGGIANAGAPCFVVDDPLSRSRLRTTYFSAFAQDEIQLAGHDAAIVSDALTRAGRVEVMALLREQARVTNAIVLLSSHDLDLSMQLADSIWLLDGNGGLCIGTPQELAKSGAVGRAFDTGAVRFSSELGRFELASPEDMTGRRLQQ